MSLSSNFPTIKPSLNLDFANVGRLDPRVTFTRASTATYYDGVTTAMAEQNLLLQSQTFQTSWVNAGTTETTDTEVAPDGTTTADTLKEDATNAVHTTTQSISFVSGFNYVGSCFFKAGVGTRSGRIVFPSAAFTSALSAYFDLQNGTVLSASAGVTASIVSVGNSWYRCIASAVATTTASGNFNIGLGDGSTASYAGDDTSTVIIWGAQIEQRSAVTAYTATTTQPITNYIPVLLTAQNNVPRFDHNPTTGAALGLLIEEQRTNLLTYSEQFDNAAWVYSRTTVSANTAVAPNGQITAASITNDTTSGIHSFASRNNYAISANTTHTYSVYLKFNGGRYVVIRLNNGADTDGASVCVDLVAGTHTAVTQNGTATGSTASITSVGNGWYRVSLTVLVDAVSTSADIRHFINQNYSTTIDSYAGSLTESLFIWGAQLEAGSFATSYIPTTTTALTRSADAASMTGTNFSGWFNNAEGTIYFDGGIPSNYSTGFLALYSINDTTANNNIQPAINASGDVINVEMKVANSVVAGFYPAYTSGFTKLSFAYKFNDVNYAKDGNAGTTDTSAAIPAVTQLKIGANQSGGNILNGYIRKIAYYPSRLSNAQLQALTG